MCSFTFNNFNFYLFVKIIYLILHLQTYSLVIPLLSSLSFHPINSFNFSLKPFLPLLKLIFCQLILSS